MSEKTIQDILPLVQMPSRYLGNEFNRIKKSWNDTKLHIALAFPDLYEIASSHFGIQILYAILNKNREIMAERVFAPALDMEKQLRDNNIPLCSLESQIPIGEFDIIGFSLLYELNYTNMLNMLDLGGITFLAEKRRKEEPLIIGGGPCTCNPEPIADFFDAIVIGDGEEVIVKMTDAWQNWKASIDRDRSSLLESWSKIKGVYIPSFFQVDYNMDGEPILTPKKSGYLAVERVVVKDLNDTPFPDSPIIPYGKPVHDRLRVEIARGCTRGCRFCQAGMIYRPVRERDPDKIISSVKTALGKTGYEDLSLLSLSTGDYTCISSVMEKIMAFGENDNVSISLPSLRAGTLTPELMELIKRVRKTGFTIAPEAGSQRLRNVINKMITEADIFRTVDNAFLMGWRMIKLYFMIGLPTETQDDLWAIVDMVKRLKAHNKDKKFKKINVSFGTFVPKPHTPFQWESQIDLETAIGKMNWLKDQLNMKGIQVKWQDPRVSIIEGVWSRGDRKLGQVLINAWKAGCRFDGWSDYFNYDRWINVFKESGVIPTAYSFTPMNEKRILPWDHINIGVEKKYLIKERKRAFKEQRTTDCRNGDCSGCGVCDFKTIKPISFQQKESDCGKEKVEKNIHPIEQSFKYLIKFKKIGFARFLAHLEMIKIFNRSFRRAKIPVKYSAGFHPMPKISFRDTLPMGMQSENEEMLITLDLFLEPETISRRLSSELLENIEIIGCYEFSKINLTVGDDNKTYWVELKDGFFKEKDLEWFNFQQSVNIERKNKKGKILNFDLKKAVEKVELHSNKKLKIILKPIEKHIIRPTQAIKIIFNLNKEDILTALITKI
ncbi:TIGR03960 family B12-binding radical SAM protein [Desulfosarcina ovata]|uniref:B12-binding protein n=1 Tax=Desulfosarcina ovata subsp. ovata TaxID=2752305 RepID=A0A5K8ADB5_9BACT|nr:TIGR03960 family B12-binding radical SAM protein [Desulfosarcina ovata]BBO90478.1 B12-binding protein [Desulfosarcina ovata subsp. ovata]